MSIESVRQNLRRTGEWLTWRRDLTLGVAGAATIALIGLTMLSLPSSHIPRGTQPAVAASVVTAAQLDAREAAAGPTGAPLLWRVKGPGASIYLFGSVHILRANMGWMDPRIYGAFDSAHEVWFEVPDPYAATHDKFLTEKAFASHPVLLNGLTDKEKAELAEVLRPFDIAPDDIPQLKPEAAAGLVNGMAELAMGYQFNRGADMSLMHQAQIYKKPIHGFETVDQHVDFINELSLLPHADGTTALKRALAVYAGQLSADGQDITSIAACWRSGDEACITRGVLAMRQSSPRGYDILLRRRNGNWVPRIEAMAKGKETVFITVGCAHLVGPDGLVAQLRAAGYQVDRVDP